MNALVQEDVAISADRQRITQALMYLAKNFELSPTLDQAAEVAGLSTIKFLQAFTQVIGVDPKNFIQHLSLKRAKEDLLASAILGTTAHNGSLSGLGRLYNLMVTYEFLTTSEWEASSLGKDVVYGWHSSPFGKCLIAGSERGICGLAFELEGGGDPTVINLFTSLGGASRKEHSEATKQFAERAFDGGDLKVVLRGTPFQLKVWEGILQIPSGAVTSYEGLARALSLPSAARAVASAVARNPVSWLVPCHRVLRANGAISGYRWGPSTKRSMLAYEAAAFDEASA